LQHAASHRRELQHVVGHRRSSVVSCSTLPAITAITPRVEAHCWPSPKQHRELQHAAGHRHSSAVSCNTPLTIVAASYNALPAIITTTSYNAL